MKQHDGDEPALPLSPGPTVPGGAPAGRPRRRAWPFPAAPAPPAAPTDPGAPAPPATPASPPADPGAAAAVAATLAWPILCGYAFTKNLVATLNADFSRLKVVGDTGSVRLVGAGVRFVF